MDYFKIFDWSVEFSKRVLPFLKKKKFLLIIDDNPDDAKLLELCLTINNCTFDTAYSAEEAVGMLHIKNYHVAFVDLRLPHMDGWELIKVIRKHSPKTRIVITAAELHDLTHIETGFYVGLIRKPVTVKGIREAMRYL
jgi:CheY-like chemotaxis protein